MLPIKLLAPLSFLFLLLLQTRNRLLPTTTLRTLRQPTTPPPSHPFCLLFDRPPRTGSSTIAAALRSCLRTHDFHQPELTSRPHRHNLVADMLALPQQRVALVSHHVFISRQDIQRLRQGCDRMFYVTSASPMRGRVWSAVKYAMVGREFEGEMTGALLQEAEERALLNTKWEPYLEHYPYLLPSDKGGEEKGWGVSFEERLVPDYVIRKDRMDEELGALLKQLGCDNKPVQSRNVHRSGGGGQAPAIPLVDKDRVYRWLYAAAVNSNAAGLRKLGEFVAQLKATDESLSS